MSKKQNGKQATAQDVENQVVNSETSQAVENEAVAETVEEVAEQVEEEKVADGDNTSPAETGDNTSPEGEKPVEGEKPADDTSAAKKKMTDEECEFLAEALKVDVGRRVLVVPFNTIKWEPGTIVGVIADKRSKKVLYAIKLDDGRRIVKTHDSELIQKQAETVEIVRKSKGATASGDKLTDEQLLEAEGIASQLVGTYINYIPFKSETKVEGKIISIVPDGRSGRILYKIEGMVDGANKISHKVSTSTDIELTEKVDTEMRDAYLKRREVRVAKLALTPEEKIAEAKKQLDKMVENRKKLDEAIAAAEIAYAEMVKAYETAATETPAAEETAPASTDAETSETEDDLN